MQNQPSQPVCPVCGHIDMVQKVSTVAGASTSNIDLSGSSTAIGVAGGPLALMGGYSTFSGQQQTHLGERLAPPPPPSYKPVSRGGSLLGMSSALLFLFYGFISLNTSDPFSWLIVAAGCIFVLLSVIVPILLGTKRRAVAASRLPRWKQAMSTWHLLYYCHRDDLVFVPGTSHYVSSYQMHQLL
jgi:hypothetical protein